MIGIFILTLVAFLISLILVAADYNTKTPVDKIEQLLPGYNCGGCGYGSCRGMAEEIVFNNVDINKCRPMKKEEKEKLKEYIEQML